MKYALFDSLDKSAAVAITGWYDTDEFTYSSLPSPADLLDVPGNIWADTIGRCSGRYVVDNNGNQPAIVVAPPPPPPTLAQQAATAIGAGLAISLSGTLTLATTLFPTDAATQAKIGSVVTTINATGAFPGGATSYPMKDAAGAWHSFTVSQYKVVAAAIAAYVASLDLIVDGNPLGATALPANSVALTV